MDQRGLAYLTGETRGLTEETIEQHHLDYDAGKDAIIIPYYDARGRFRGSRLRYLGGESRYHSESGWHVHLYNVVDSASPTVYITEGEFDCLVLKQVGLDAVALPGANTFQPAWRWLFMGTRVFLAFDGDDAGKKATLVVRRHLSGVALDCTALRIPAGHDITSLHLAGELDECLSAAN